VTYRHNVVRDFVFRICKQLGMDAAREPSIPDRVPGAEGRRPDLLFRGWEGGQDLFVDVVGSSSLQVEVVVHVAVSNLRAVVPGGPSIRVVVRREASYRERSPLLLNTSRSVWVLGGGREGVCKRIRWGC
jgi:hypothetical protein